MMGADKYKYGKLNVDMKKTSWKERWVS